MEIQRPYKMFMETAKRSTLVLAISISFTLLLICLIIAGISTPSMTKTKSFFLESCSLTKSDSCFASQDSYTLEFTIKDIKRKNHFLYYEFIPYFNSRELIFFMAYNLTATSDSKSYKKIKHAEEIYTLKDSEPEVLAYIPYTLYDAYHLNLTFNSTSSLLSAFRLKVTYMEIDYFNFLIAVKYFFFSLTVLFLIWFLINSCCRVPIKTWVFETYSTFIMTLSLLVYNEPLIGGYTEIFENGYMGVSVFCNAQFFCLVIMYFLFLIQKIVISWRRKVFYLVEMLFVLLLFALYFAIYLYVEVNMKYDSKFDYQDLEDEYLSLFKAFIAVLVFIACAILVFMVVGVWSWIANDARYILYWVFNYCVVVLTFVFIGMGYFRLMIGGQAILGVVAMYNISFYLLLWMCAPDKNTYMKEEEPNSEEERISKEYRFRSIDNQA